MTKQEIVNYVCETPGNTNPAVLRSMLDSISENYRVKTASMVINSDLTIVPTQEEALEIRKIFEKSESMKLMGYMKTSIHEIPKAQIGLGGNSDNLLHFGGCESGSSGMSSCVVLKWRDEGNFKIVEARMNNQDISSVIIGGTVSLVLSN